MVKRLYRGYIGIREKNMETTIYSVDLCVCYRTSHLLTAQVCKLPMQYKFIVDDNWTINPKLPLAQDCLVTWRGRGLEF